MTPYKNTKKIGLYLRQFPSVQFVQLIQAVHELPRFIEKDIWHYIWSSDIIEKEIIEMKVVISSTDEELGYWLTIIVSEVFYIRIQKIKWTIWAIQNEGEICLISYKGIFNSKRKMIWSIV